MKKHLSLPGLVAALLIAAAICAPFFLRAQHVNEPVMPEGPQCEITEEAIQEIAKVVAANIQKLQAEGRYLPPSNPAKFGNWIFPLQPMVFQPWMNPSHYAVSNFMDRNKNAGLLKDYTCNTRTYDGHSGTDIFPWPFPHFQMWNNYNNVVAAGGGMLIGKSDGMMDVGCALGGVPPNQAAGNWAVIDHGGNIFSLYCHMKMGSVLLQPIGTPVAMGQILGTVGTSGNSSGSHLHFEVRNAINVNQLHIFQFNQLIDPFNGNCNPNPSCFSAQRPYWDSNITALLMHSAVPNMNTCPNPEMTNENYNWQVGSTVMLGAYLVDWKLNQKITFRLRRPNGTVLKSWQVNNTAGNYYWAYWLTTNTLTGNNVTPGMWQAEATFKGITLFHPFAVWGPPIGQSPAEQTEGLPAEKVFDSFSWYDAQEQKLITDFTGPLRAAGTLELYNLSGQQLFSGKIDAGIQTAEFSVNGLSKGIYVSKVFAGGNVFTNKIWVE